MISCSAFHNDPTTKQAALEDAREARHPGWASTASDEDRQALAAAFGLDPALTGLLGYIYRVPFGGDFAGPLVGALEAIPLGADTRAIVRGWMLSVWKSSELGAEPHIANTQLHTATAKIVELIRASAATTVPRDQWRQARKALVAAKAALPELSHYADLAAAMAWDISTTPGAATDFWRALEAVAFAPLRSAAKWSKADEDVLLEDARLAIRRAVEELGQRPSTGEAAAAYSQHYDLAFRRHLAELGQAERYASWLEFAERAGPAMRQWQKKPWHQ